MFYNMSNPLRFVDDSKRDNQQKKKKRLANRGTKWPKQDRGKYKKEEGWSARG